MIRKCLLYTVLLVLSCHAYSTDYYVRSGGSDTWPCGSTVSPCGKISTVINQVTGDANIRVAQGTYDEFIHIYSSDFNNVHIGGGWNSAFTAQNCNPELTVLQSSHYSSSLPVVLIDAEIFQHVDVDLTCLTFNGVSDIHRTGIDIHASHGGLTFSMSQSIINDFAGHGMYLYSVRGIIDMDIDKTVFKNSYQLVGQFSSGGGISAAVYNDSRLTITLQNSIMYGNQATGGAAIDLKADEGSSINALLLNSTISDNYSPDIDATSSGGLRLLAFNSGQAVVNIQNTILWGNSNMVGSRDISIYEGSTGVATVDSDYSVVGEVFIFNGNGTYIDNGNNMNIDPKLNSTYRLSSDSPAIDMAQCGTHFFTYTRIAPYDDIDGDLRPGYGALLGCDIGADEFAAHGCFPYTPNGKMLMICW